MPALIEGERVPGWKVDDAIAGLVLCPTGLDPDRPESWKSAVDDLSVSTAAGWKWAAARGK